MSKTCVFFLAILISSCARKGRPEGGPKDEDAPIMITANPPYESINFNEKAVKIYFDEYVVLKDLTKQLVVSPPLKSPLVITPQGTPSKYFNIKILDTLKPNTTYTFNFGNAVQDNNEGNKLESFKYVFSTGTTIDSLEVSGNITHSFNREKEKNISILLYKLDSSFTDSIVYKKKPEYVTNTLDSTHFNFTNIKEGKYFMMALKEPANDYLFNPKTDQLGFINDTIELPRDSIIAKEIRLFREKQPFKFKRGKELFKGKIQFGFEGGKKGLKVKLLSKTSDSFESFTQFEKEKDTLFYWHTPLEVDSLNFLVMKKDFIDTITVRLRKKKIDSLKVMSSISSILNPRDTLFLETNNPIKMIDSTKFSFVDKDTIKVPYTLKKMDINRLAVLFESKRNWNYRMQVLPNAIGDLYETKNDTLNYQFGTKDIEDYGSIVLDIRNTKNKMVIIQLLLGDKVAIEEKIKSSKKITFDLLEPKEYTVRAIIDDNNNGIWDTGNYLKRIQPEEVLYMPQEFKLRANWIQNEIFEIE
ncbi:Ig-like domain-containing protein [Tenacibaculum sp. MAR_2009_124]|uniref:Ig-like domain-containing protein n=1 Tax=Tenacibaculum sp. MAR_2009_124 TaxID=1250059 RepID=UPI000B83073A|nr:Ig-like domain-containing protein [Tenacibaculum sp. MAR_2009_124]